MTEIEQQALALVDEVMAEVKRGGLAFRFLPEASQVVVAEALVRALEQKAALQAEFDQFRQEVSDAVEAWRDADVMSKVSAAAAKLHSFILPKPVDPLVTALCSTFGADLMGPGDLERFRTALAENGLEISETE